MVGVKFDFVTSFEFSQFSANMTKLEVGIIGTGDYARALAKRLLYGGYTVTCGSRSPERKNLAEIDPALKDVSITSITECITKSTIIFIAVPPEVHNSIKTFAEKLEGKVVVDVSNPVSEEDANALTESIAENLSQLLPSARVVKAFNTLSAYGLEVDASITTGNRDVLVAGDDPNAKASVMQLARDLGFTAVDYGGLKMARELEKIPVLLFNGWGLATKVIIIMFPIWLALGYARYYVLKDPPFPVSRFPTNFLNKIMACMAVTLLAFCFMPGCFATFIQIRNGTKYIRFSKWLDQWLKMRKQLGIYGLMFALMHIIMSVTVIQPAYFPDWFVVSSVEVQVPDGSHTVSVPISSIMNLKGTIITYNINIHTFLLLPWAHPSIVYSLLQNVFFYFR